MVIGSPWSFPSLGVATPIFFFFLTKLSFSLCSCVKFSGHLIISVALHWTISSTSRFLLNWEDQIWQHMPSRVGWSLPLISWLQDCKCGPGPLSLLLLRGHIVHSCSAYCLPDPLSFSGEIGRVFRGKTSLIDTGGHSVGVNASMLPQSLKSRALNVKCFMQVFLHYLSYKLKQILVVTKPNPQTLSSM